MDCHASWGDFAAGLNRRQRDPRNTTLGYCRLFRQRGHQCEMGVRGLLIYCADYRCSHSIAISGDAWPDDARLSDIEERFTCRVCGKRGADVRPDFNWNRKQVGAMGYR